MSKPIIAIDIDDVLAANAAGFVKYSNERWGTHLTVEDYDEHWGKIWQVDHAEVERRALELHESGIFAEYNHYEEALDVLQRLKRHYTLLCATSRRLSIKDLTEEWLHKYYPNIFETVHYAGIYDAAIVDASYARTKKDVLLKIGADYLIDDQLKHCFSAAEAGVQAIVFGDYSWNREDSLPENVTRCLNWSDVGAYFEQRKA